jgi:hypothetical protein
MTATSHETAVLFASLGWLARGSAPANITSRAIGTTHLGSEDLRARQS